MAKTTTLKTTLTAVEKMRSSVNGNPRWRLITAHGVYSTKRDTAVALEITDERWPLVGTEVQLTMDGPDRVWNIVPA